MAIKEFNFTKDWNNPADFPATAASTKQARQNIQLLHDETKTYLNETVRPAIEAGEKNLTEEIKKVNVEVAGRVKLPESGNGEDGQYAVSDGAGGIRWVTMINRGITGG